VIAEPPGVVRGGLVVLHEAQGNTDTMGTLLDALAAEGWLVIAPRVDAELADTDIALSWLTQQGIDADRMGVVGFESGGAVAMVVAARRNIGAAVSVAGGEILRPLSPGLPAVVDIAGELRCPWLGLYGDKYAEEVALLRDAASRSATATDVVLFPAADHRFDIHPDAAFEAWQRMLNWFDAHLR
jgi:carboxymethylenebutenolidase